MASDNAPLEQQIVADHQEAKDLHAQYKKTGDIVFFNQFVWALSRHSIGEEIIVYPILEKLGDATVAELKKEHAEVAKQLQKISSLNHPSQEFDSEFDKLIVDLSQHIQKEETHDLQLLKTKLPLEERIAEGQRFLSRKKIVPTRPHVGPENPTALEAVGLLLAPVDKFLDLFRSYPSEEQLAASKGAAAAAQGAHHANQ